MTHSDPPVALITGASRGLGLEIARVFAQRGWALILNARGAETLVQATAGLTTGTQVMAVPGDVSDATSARALVEQGIQRFGHIDVLINNASTLGPTPMPELADLDPEALADILKVNAIAPLHLIQRVLPSMRQRKHGVIINVTSDAGVEAYPTWGGYGASKATLEHLSRVLAAELEGTGIRVYVVDPGDMDTAMHRDAEPGEDLSHLPGPAVPAPAFLHLVEHETAPFGRYSASALIADVAHVSG